RLRAHRYASASAAAGLSADRQVGGRISADRRRAQDAAEAGGGRARSPGSSQADRGRFQRRQAAAVESLRLLPLLHARRHSREQLVAAMAEAAPPRNPLTFFSPLTAYLK